MYRIVIAEDEEEVRKSIIKCIDDSDTEYCVVGEAANGLEAVEQIEKWNPDILVTDICMPWLNGLELIRKIREVNENIEMVIVSGYDEFQYVKEAMSMGVRDYLLKPFLPDELFGVLDKISKTLKHQAALVQNIEVMQNEIRQNQMYSQEHFLRQLIQSEELPPDPQKFFDTEANWYTCCIVRFFGKDKEKKAVNFGKMMKLYLQIIEENYFSSEIHCYSLNDSNHQVALMICCHESNIRQAKQDVQTGIEKIGSSMEFYYGIQMRVTVGSFVSDFKNLKNSYHEALKTWKSILEMDQVLAFYQDKKAQNPTLSDLKEQKMSEEIEAVQKELLLAIQMAEKENAIELMNQLLKCYAELSGEQNEYISLSLSRLVLDISMLTNREKQSKVHREDREIIDFLEKNIRYGSLLEARMALERYIEKSCSHFQGSNEKQGEKIINKALTFIDYHLSNEDLNLEMVAESLHFSPSYIRKLFKSVTGENFSDLLVRKRMEKAAEYLENPNCRIQDIAEKTGYNNQRYFARCFKKYYNCTPTEYRNRF
ncbi:MAG: response regulator [Lachnospiraceae bacterium]|nr:response regulator [Lachnospiraceae bacterium]